MAFGMYSTRCYSHCTVICVWIFSALSVLGFIFTFFAYLLIELLLITFDTQTSYDAFKFKWAVSLTVLHSSTEVIIRLAGSYYNSMFGVPSIM